MTGSLTVGTPTTAESYGAQRLDILATEASQGDNLPPDPGSAADVTDNPKKASVERATPATPPPPSKKKMTEIGQPCRKCQTPVVRRVPKKRALKPTPSYYFAWYLYCPECEATYMVEEAKRDVQDAGRVADSIDATECDRPSGQTASTTDLPAELSEIVAAWNSLPAVVRAGMLAMVRATR